MYIFHRSLYLIKDCKEKKPLYPFIDLPFCFVYLFISFLLLLGILCVVMRNMAYRLPRAIDLPSPTTPP